MLQITDNNFNEINPDNKPIVIKFYLDGCGPCVKVSPIFEQFCENNKENIIVGETNLRSNPILKNKYNVTGAPTVVFIKNNNIFDKIVGFGSNENIYNETLERMLNETSEIIETASE